MSNNAYYALLALFMLACLGGAIYAHILVDEYKKSRWEAEYIEKHPPIVAPLVPPTVTVPVEPAVAPVVEPITLPGTSQSQGTLRCETGCPLRSQEEPTGMSRRSVSPAKPAAVSVRAACGPGGCPAFSINGDKSVGQKTAEPRQGFFRRWFRNRRGG